MPGYKTRQTSGSAGPHNFLKASTTLGISSVNSRFGAAKAKTKHRPEEPFPRIIQLTRFQILIYGFCKNCQLVGNYNNFIALMGEFQQVTCEIILD